MIDDGMGVCEEKDLERVRPIIGSSFSRDPVWRRIFEPHFRLRGTTAFFGAAVSYIVSKGRLLHSGNEDGSYVGIIDWHAFSMMEMLNLDPEGLIIELLSSTDLDNALSLWRMAEHYDSSVAGDKAEADIYLFLFFTHPLRKGEGEGSKVMRSLIRALDELNLSCSLSTHNRLNLPMYEHLGFRTVISQTNDRGDDEFFLIHP